MSTTPQKKQEDLVDLSRKPIVNQLQAVKDSLIKRPPRNNMHGLVVENTLTWALKNLAHLGNSRYPYQVYAKPSVNNGIFPIVAAGDTPVNIALLGDWASATEESILIARLAGEPDYSIHLGDTYYVGNSKEIADNFNDTFGGPWPYGTHGSFAMLGNHEMYSGGKSYFTELLPYMGAYGETRETQRQEASFFCLESEHWRIIGLDTGYDSLKGLLGLTPNAKLELHPHQVAWLRDVVQPGKDKRGIVLLTHHPPFSAFERAEFQKIFPQLLPLLGEDRTVLWLCGHEHRLALYGYNLLAGKTGCYLRCIGHGGMPVEPHRFRPKSPEPSDPANRNLALFDRRVRKTLRKGIDLGHNGYAMMALSGPELVLSYFDDSFLNADGVRVPIVEEQWTVDLGTGVLKGERIVDNTAGVVSPGVTVEPARLTHFQSDIRVAIGRV